MTTRASQFEILASGVQYNADLVTTPYVKFFAAGTDTAKNAWDDKEKASAITKKALDTQGRAEVFGDGIYKLKFYTGDPDAAPPNTGVLLFEIDDYKVQAAEFNVVNKTGAYTATPDDDVVLCSGTFTLSIQDVANFERPLEVVNTGTGTITIDPYSTQTIEGSSTLELGAGELIRLVPDASGNIWRWVDFISDVATHAAATGTSVHGLGTMSTQTIAAVTASIVPDSDNAIDLGSSSKEFRNLYVDGTANLDAISTDGVTVASTGNVTLSTGSVVINSINQGKDVTAALHRKILEIGDWNMDSASTKDVAHGLTFTKIRRVSAIIRDDANANYYPIMPYCNYITNFAAMVTHIDSVNVNLTREGSGIFDQTTFDATGYNRGWIIIDYVD